MKMNQTYQEKDVYYRIVTVEGTRYAIMINIKEQIREAILELLPRYENSPIITFFVETVMNDETMVHEYEIKRIRNDFLGGKIEWSVNEVNYIV